MEYYYVKFTLRDLNLFTCSVSLSTSGRVSEAQKWSGGRRYIRLVCTAPQSDKAVGERNNI